MDFVCTRVWTAALADAIGVESLAALAVAFASPGSFSFCLKDREYEVTARVSWACDWPECAHNHLATVEGKQVPLVFGPNARPARDKLYVELTTNFVLFFFGDNHNAFLRHEDLPSELYDWLDARCFRRSDRLTRKRLANRP